MSKILELEKYHLAIHSGDKVLIKGPMASGKTKLLHEIAQQLPVHQFDFLYQTLDDNFVAGTVAENLAFNLENDAVAHEKMVTSVKTTAENYGLSDDLHTDIDELPTYQKRVLALAQVLIRPTDILLLDEPLFLPENFDGTLIVTGDFDENLFDQVFVLSNDLTDSSTPLDEPALSRQINPDKAILSVTELIKDMSFVVHEGEKIILTTTSSAPIADMLAGFRATSGEIDFYYEDITHQSLDRRGQKIGYVMANPSDMIFVSRVSDAGISDDLLKLCGLEKFKTEPITKLTFRQKRLLTTACILMQETPIVIFDQPEFEHFSDILTYLDHKGVTVILVTNQTQFMPFVDRQEVF